MSAHRPEPGTEISFQWRKWDGSPHWHNAGVYLGSDAAGDWIGQPRGWQSTRPGAVFTADEPNVSLIPPAPDHAVTLYRAHPRDLRVYVDLGWDIRWTDDPLVATGIDMDLDVIRRENDRGTYVDDRDEFAEHQVLYGYPAGVIAHLEALALRLEADVRAQRAPFDTASAAVWLDRLAGFGLDR